MSVVRVNDLKKDFQYYKKEEGLKSSLHNLFFRKSLTRNAVKGISFSVEEGEFIGFLGPNGAGKTTTLKMLSGIMYPTSGTATVLGHVPWKRENAFKKQFSIVMGQKNQLWWDLPAIESLYLNKCIYELEDGEYNKTLDALSEYLNVKELLNIQVRRLSLGERMKLELIASLLHHPKVIFLDEPTIGLDIIAQKNIRDFLKYYNQQEKATVLLTSHYMKDIEELCRRTVIINQGELVYDGDITDINKALGQKKIIKMTSSQPLDKSNLESFGSLRSLDETGAMLEVDRNDISRISQDIFKRFNVTDITIEDIPLEESIELLYTKGGVSHAVSGQI